jgi:glucose-1-phosphate thymidylyltransferase
LAVSCLISLGKRPIRLLFSTLLSKLNKGCLAGGSGTRLYPVMRIISKQRMPADDKPMIYYPLSTLMLAGIREILIISTPQDLQFFERLLGQESQLEIQLACGEQRRLEGLAQAFIIGKDFIGEDNVALIFWDNIFYGESLSEKLQQAAKLNSGAAFLVIG